MAIRIPSQFVQEAFLQGTSRLLRYVEIYEKDGKTPWRQDLWPDLLSAGSVNCDYSRDDLRNVDLTLNNIDGDLNPVAGKFWYDKIIKPFFGIELVESDRPVSVAIVEDYGVTAWTAALRSLLASSGVDRTFYRPDAITLADVEAYDVLISVSVDYTRKQSLLNAAYAAGKGIITCGLTASAAELTQVIGTTGSVVSYTDYRDIRVNSLVASSLTGWADWKLVGSGSYRQIITGKNDVQTVGYTSEVQNGTSAGVLAKESKGGQRWIHLLQNDFRPSAFYSPFDMARAAGFLAAAVAWTYNFTEVETWTIQMGEYCIDQLGDADDYGDLVKVTGRDYVKRCQNSKLAKATMFRAAEKIDDIIRTLAVNSGITKFDMVKSGIALGKDQTWERDVSRWDIMKEIAQANSMYLYFDNEGYLMLVPMEDPILSSPAIVLKSGIGGNLVSRSARSSDTELFNRITVVGESSDSNVPLVFGDAFNNNASSPTSIQEIGERVKNISSALITTDAQAQRLAEQMLSVSMLEQFEVQFGSIMLPWIRPGHIIELSDGTDDFWAPSRYLLTTLDFPLDLGPMTGTAKRITKFS